MNKIELIKEYKDTIIAAFNFYLDYLYGLTENFTENGELKEGIQLEEGIKTLLSDSLARAEQYEKIREKIIQGNFNLSIVEIDYISLMLFFWITMTSKHIATLQKAVDLATELQNALLIGSSIDKSQVIDITNIEKVN